VRGLPGRSEGVADLFPCGPLDLASQPDVVSCQAVGRSGQTGSGYGEEQMWRRSVSRVARVLPPRSRLCRQLLYRSSNEFLRRAISIGRLARPSSCHGEMLLA
jgi:hypothetical protein